MLTLDEVRRIADLARIEVPEGEVAALQQQLNGIFGLIEQMRAVDTAGVEPMAHAIDLTQRLREDAVTEEDRHALYQEGAPQVEAGLYLVPKVIE
ncbi:MAG: Asp-tRNA(Asn)/Glu-tRNA(Gln) amidotransferase subunit GatC [Betaproteobacteria bacterium]|jgi:aspartyl-tRNA(Asn)/glutamyl-tRNA(Gln) amidotransferase subunit C|nr:Asp-tRNA(Asn)/Glu-tRNA(Gln) amidotransferase subunit GatC [Betaproteobacteria bacterium]